MNYAHTVMSEPIPVTLNRAHSSRYSHSQRCLSRKERMVASQWLAAEGERIPWRSPVNTCSWYGLPAETRASSREEVCVNKTFSSVMP